MNKWRKRRARKWQARYNALFVPKPSETCLRCGHVYEEHSDSICMVEDCECDCFDWSRVSRLCRKSCKREADELRQDVLRSATELARVQGVCDELSVDEAEAVNQLEATRQQVRKHAATIIDLREREHLALEQAARNLVIAGEYYQERDALLAWQRRVREAWAAYDAEDEVEASTLDRLRQAIEAEAKEET